MYLLTYANGSHSAHIPIHCFGFLLLCVCVALADGYPSAFSKRWLKTKENIL